MGSDERAMLHKLPHLRNETVLSFKKSNISDSANRSGHLGEDQLSSAVYLTIGCDEMSR